MPAYVIVEIEVRDAEQYERYKELAAPSVRALGGRYIARGGRTETLEGSWAPTRLVVLEFPTMQQARDWYASPQYQEAAAVRQGCASAKMILTEGYDG